jgi:hypothetical protein
MTSHGKRSLPGSEFILTYDKDRLRLGNYGDIKIANAAAFLKSSPGNPQ